MRWAEAGAPAPPHPERQAGHRAERQPGRDQARQPGAVREPDDDGQSGKQRDQRQEGETARHFRRARQHRREIGHGRQDQGQGADSETMCQKAPGSRGLIDGRAGQGQYAADGRHGRQEGGKPGGKMM